MLTVKQARFVEEYLKDLNATQAAIRAGYSPKRADAIGYENLSKPEIASAVQAAIAQRAERTRVDADRLLLRLAEMMDADSVALFGPAGELLPVDQWPLVWRQGLVAGLDVAEVRGEGGKVVATVRKVRLADRLKVLELIGRHVDISAWREKVDVSVTATLAERLARARARNG